MKTGISLLLCLVCGFFLLSGCYVYGPPPTGAVGPAPGYHHHEDYQERPYDNAPPSGAVGPAPTHDHAPYEYAPPPPPPSGAVGPARY